MTKDIFEHPILVYGPRKAGTTLLQNLLDGGSKILMMPSEFKINRIVRKLLTNPFDKKYYYLTSGKALFRKNISVTKEHNETKLKISDDFRIQNLPKETMLNLFDPKAYVKGLEKIFDDKIKGMKDIYKVDFNSFKDALKNDPNDYAYWAFKEVGGFRPQELVAHVISLFPKAKFVFIARDPKFVVRSIIRNRHKLGIKLPFFKILKECYEAQTIIEYYYEIKNYKNKSLIFYEDLVDDTEREMKKIMEYLNVEYEKIYEIPTIFGKNVRVSTSSKDTKTVFKNPNTNWKSELKIREIMAIKSFDFVYRILNKIFGRQMITYKDLCKL